ncbi:ComF family protein [Pontiella agarivorans]|uniref:ComF family protein n=1 Tax=Pontiella agarivorans TaxID=3038953 RepID=A0ABU5MXV3_9BACT|nr:ComF family protein [Pontiella agarivorans]MDZ8119046.1 ComF family protein [Pontiella agarivorans]
MTGWLDMLYPRNCIGCGVSAPETFRFICWDCWSDASMVEPPFCALCGDPVAGSVEHDFICYACSAEKPAFDAARSAVRYEGVAGEALRQLKYEHALHLVPDLAQILFNCLQAEFPGLEVDRIVPVPLFHVRRRERGYNQSGELARALGSLLRVKSSAGILRRIRPTATQTNLTAPQRLSNVRNAFETRREQQLAGKRILLVDDVMTTGATVNACAKALKKGGAASVHVLTVARG